MFRGQALHRTQKNVPAWNTIVKTIITPLAKIKYYVSIKAIFCSQEPDRQSLTTSARFDRPLQFLKLRQTI